MSSIGWARFPGPDDAGAVAEEPGMRIWTAPVPALRDELRAAVAGAPAVEYHHLE